MLQHKRRPLPNVLERGLPYGDPVQACAGTVCFRDAPTLSGDIFAVDSFGNFHQYSARWSPGSLWIESEVLNIVFKSNVVASEVNEEFQGRPLQFCVNLLTVIGRPVPSSFTTRLQH
jgi:hypothetical protein